MTRGLAAHWRKLGLVIYSLVGSVDVVDGQDGQVAVITEIAQGDALAGLEAELVNGLLRQVQGDGHGEEDAIGETVLLDDAARFLLAFCLKCPSSLNLDL